MLGNLRARAAAGDPAWTKLQATCDGLLGGTVYWPEPKGDPSVNDYPDPGSVGEGYQGDGYVGPLLDAGLCYEVVKASDPAKAAAYGAKGVDILVHMSDPPGAAHYQDPLRDSGYGIRNYGVGMAVGYDWLFDAMTPDQQQRVIAALNLWVSKFASGGFLPNFPMANYFAGYFAAKGLTALATSGENANAAALWSSWHDGDYVGMVQPYYAAHVAGGGWAEGWNYGQLASLNMQFPVLAALSANGMNLVSGGGADFGYVGDQGLNLIHFTWPSRLTLDDRGSIYQGANPTATRGQTYTVQSGFLEAFGSPNAPVFHAMARFVRDNGGEPGSPWEDFLFWDDSAPETPVESLPLSYLAPGMGAVAMRSSWATDAVWASMMSGPYTGSGDSGEEYYDEGGLAIVRGSTPFLVNATGFLVRDMPGVSSAWFNETYAENYQGNPPPRSMYNIFYNAPGGQSAIGPSQASTHVDLFEDASSYVYSRGVGLEQVYTADRGIAGWSREVMFVRPNVFVVHDVTSTSTIVDPRMSFHLARTPAQGASPASGVSRWDVADGSTFIGSVSTVFPLGAATSLTNVFSSNKVYRLDVRPAAASAKMDWVTVFDASTSQAAVAAASPIGSASGNASANVVGTALASNGATTVLVFGAGGTITAAANYTVAASDSENVVADLPPGATFSVTATSSGAGTVVTITPGGSFTATQAGVLRFHVAAGGAVTAG